MVDELNNIKDLLTRFDKDKYRKYKNYQMLSILNTLDISSDIFISYLKDENNLTKGDLELRLFALFQALFVSIDCLYDMAYNISSSKNFININSNPVLRELKYIRNDVVGHPTNRIINQRFAYALLDSSSITKESFTYKSYYENTITEKNVNINEIIKSYINESTPLLLNLISLSNNKVSNKALENDLNLIASDFISNESINKSIEQFKNDYMLIYPDSTNSTHRVLYRMTVIEKLNELKLDDENLNELIRYSIFIEIIKINKLLKFNVFVNNAKPKIIKALYKFLNKSKEARGLIAYLRDYDHPFFLKSLINNIKLSSGSPLANLYYKYVYELYSNNDFDILYGVLSIIRNYKMQ